MPVYFIRARKGGAIKIGYSAQPESRRIAIQIKAKTPMVILATLPGGRANEGLLHRYFAHLHIEREWFQADDELLNFIANPKPFSELAKLVGPKIGRTRRLS